jgi:hypothetical protein
MSKEHCDDMKTELKKFLVQATTGPIMAQLRIGNCNITSDVLNICLAIYLNICWHSFNNKNDEYITNTFSKILNFGIIKGSVCLFHWIKTIGENMINMIDFNSILEDLDAIETLDEKRNILIKLMSEAFDALEPQLNLEKMKCDGEKCDNSYDGNDLFTLSVQSIESEDHSD